MNDELVENAAGEMVTVVVDDEFLVVETVVDVNSALVADCVSVSFISGDEKPVVSHFFKIFICCFHDVNEVSVFVDCSAVVLIVVDDVLLTCNCHLLRVVFSGRVVMVVATLLVATHGLISIADADDDNSSSFPGPSVYGFLEILILVELPSDEDIVRDILFRNDCSMVAFAFCMPVVDPIEVIADALSVVVDDTIEDAADAFVAVVDVEDVVDVSVVVVDGSVVSADGSVVSAVVVFDFSCSNHSLNSQHE